jgi:hypothetical protein
VVVFFFVLAFTNGLVLLLPLDIKLNFAALKNKFVAARCNRKRVCFFAGKKPAVPRFYCNLLPVPPFPGFSFFRSFFRGVLTYQQFREHPRNA